MRIVLVCLLVAAAAVACVPSRGVRLAPPGASSDRRAPGNSLVEIDPRTGNVVRAVRLVDPGPVVVSGSSVWVASPPRRTVWQIDARSARVLATTHLAATPIALASGPAGSAWVVTAAGMPAVIQLDAETGKIAKRFAAPCCPGPSAIASTPSGALWIAGRAGVQRINPNSGVRTIVAAHLRAAAIAAAPGGGAYVSDGFRRVTPVPTGGRPGITLSYRGKVRQALAPEPAGLVFSHGTLWVVDGATRSVVAFPQAIIDSGFNLESATVAVGREPFDIAYGEGSVWVANRRDGTISQIDPNPGRVIKTIPVGYRPSGLAVGAGALWVTTRRASATAGATGLLAFDDHGQIYTSRPDGTHRRQLTHARWPLQDVMPCWSPDGRRIVFLHGRHDDAVDFKPLALSVMNADGTRQRRIPHTTDSTWSGAPAWSPDETRIAFSAGKRGRIYTIAPDGTHRVRVARVAKSYDVAWAPDGRQIGFDSNAPSLTHSLDDHIFNVYAIRLDGTRLRRLTRIPSQYVAWSPNGRWIVFSRYDYEASATSAKFLGEFIAPASGGPGVRLLPPTNNYPGLGFGAAVVSWSPDETAIAVSGLPGASPPAIYIANADGTGLSYVTRGNDATWRPVP